jgi:glycosyltransferase involved in cell wall biosynthesis
MREYFNPENSAVRSMPGSAPTCELSLVCPAFNEAENLPEVLAEWDAVLRQAGRLYEMIIVDDGSTDATADVLRESLCSYATLRVLRLQRRSGQSAALAAGLDAARGRWIITSDADLQNDPADLPRMLALCDRFDLVCGWRVQRQDTWMKRLISRIANAWRRRVLDDSMHDSGCGLKLLRRELAESVVKFDGMHRFLPALARMAGFRVTETSVAHRARRRGQSKYGVFNRLAKPIGDLRGVAWLRARRLSYVAAEQSRHDVESEHLARAA